MGGRQSLQETLLNLKMTSKQLKRMSAQCAKNEAAEKKKAVEAMGKGNLDVARVYVGNAIREKTQSLNFLKLSSRIDGVASRVATAVKMNTLTKAMTGVVDGMDSALKSMDPDKIAKVMDKFESQFSDLDVRTAYMDGAMDSSLSTTTPMDQVDSLMVEIGSEAQLNMGEIFAKAGQRIPTALPGAAAAAPAAAARTMVPLGAAVGGTAPPPAAGGPPGPSGGLPGGPAGPSGPSGGLPAADPASDLAARLAALKAK